MGVPPPGREPPDPDPEGIRCLPLDLGSSRAGAGAPSQADPSERTHGGAVPESPAVAPEHQPRTDGTHRPEAPPTRRHPLDSRNGTGLDWPLAALEVATEDCCSPRLVTPAVFSGFSRTSTLDMHDYRKRGNPGDSFPETCPAPLRRPDLLKSALDRLRAPRSGTNRHRAVDPPGESTARCGFGRSRTSSAT